MSHSVRSHLRVEVGTYDTTIRRFIPGYEAMLSEAAGPVAAVLPSLVVDLGAGTGALSEELLQRTGVGRVRLLDIDPEMLEHARVRLAPFGDRVELSLASFETPLPEADAYVASLALHHLPTIDEKEALFGRVFAVLRPGGVLVNADVTMPDDEVERDALYRFWIDHMGRHGIDRKQASSHLAEWAEEDTYLPLDAELAALASVGFDARCVWRLGPMTVVVARKPWIV